MCPEVRSERGVGLIAAVFVIVVLAMLGTGLVRIATTEQSAVSREMASNYALLAGESAAQWGLYQVLARGNSSLAGDQPLTSPTGGLADCAGTEIADNDPDGVERFGTVQAPGGSRDLYRFRVAGICFPGSPETTRREVEVRFAVP